MGSRMRQEEFDATDLLQCLHGPVFQGHVDVVTACRVIDCQCELGEGILYDDQRHLLIWTDITSKRFHRLELARASDNHQKIRHQTYDLDKKLGSMGMVDGKESALLCAWEDGFQLYDIEHSTALSDMSEGEPVNPLQAPTRLNDGRVDPEGRRYICGGYYGGVAGAKMKVFQVEQRRDGKLHHTAIVDEIQTTNSISWSPDGTTMYLADSALNQIHSYRYNADDGTLANKTLLHETDAKLGVPDGSCVDSEGFLWNAVWRQGKGPGMVQRIDPNSGKVVYTVHMPDGTSQVTCCCFGGEDNDILFITTAAEGRDPAIEPHAGALYAAKLPFKGRKESRLKFQC